MESAIELITKERSKQTAKMSIESDWLHNDKNQLVDAAVVLIRVGDNESGLYYPPANWSEIVFNGLLDKPRKERLIIAAALLAAEIDRLQYNEAMENGGITVKK